MTRIICLLLLWSPGALAQTVGIDRTHPSVDLQQDLESSRPGDRLVAARTLKHAVTAGLRRSTHARDPLDRREAEIDVHDACSDAAASLRRAIVQFRDVRRPLADVAALCGDPDSLPAVRDARAAETRAGVLRHLDAAVAALEAR